MPERPRRSPTPPRRAGSGPATSRPGPRDARSAPRREETQPRRAARRRFASRSWLHHDGAAHVFVSAAAEDAAVEGEAAWAIRNEADPRHAAGFDLLVDLEVGQGEAVLAIERGDLEHHRNADSQLDHGGRELELLRRDLDDLRAVVRDEDGGREKKRDHQPALAAAGTARPSIECSVSRQERTSPASAASRKPRPRPGC